MDRNVRTMTSGTFVEGTLQQPPAQEKLVKFFPAEALALYSGLEPLAVKLAGSDDGQLKGYLWGALAVSSLFCLMFLRSFWHVTNSQAAISTVCLVLYVSALGGPFSTVNGYDPLMGVAAAIIASAFMIFVKAPAPPAP